MKALKKVGAQLQIPMIGAASQAIDITHVSLRGRVYTVDLDYVPLAPDSFDLRTPWAIKHVTGASFEAVSPGLYRFTPTLDSQPENARSYRHGQVQVTFVPQ